MERRGFTLVEVLAIIAVLGVMVVLVVPQLGGNTSTKEEKELEKVKEIIETAAKSYHSFNQDEYKISVDELVNNSYLTPNLTDPTTGEKLNGCVIVTKNKEGDYDYTYTSCDDFEVPLTIELNGGTTTQSFEDSYFNGTKIKLIEPTKQESIFNRWEIVEGNSILKNNTLIIGNTATTLYALWDAWPRLTVDLNEGTTTQEFKNSYQSRTSFILTNPTRTGYTFSGWEITEGDSIISGNNFTMGSKNTTIKASWVIDTYTITYNLGGGTSGTNSPTSGTYGSTVTVSNPTRTGYTFNGWTVSGTGASMSGTSLTIGTGNITLTANWEISDTTAPTCTLSANSSTITASASDTGGSSLAYNGWSSTYSGSNSTSKSIATGTHTYYVKDGAGNTGSCSISITTTTQGLDCGGNLQDSGGCYYWKSATKTASGSCVCKLADGVTQSGTCTTSKTCTCPSQMYEYINSCSISYSCSSGYLASTSCKVYTSGTTTYTCSSGYTKINNTYCYK